MSTVFVNNSRHRECPAPQAAEPALAQAPPPVHGLPSLKQVGCFEHSAAWIMINLLQ